MASGFRGQSKDAIRRNLFEAGLQIFMFMHIG